MSHIRTLSRIAMAAAVVVAIGSFAQADVLTQTFDDGTNNWQWTWGFGDSIPTSGGNPNGYLRTDGLDTFAPQPRPVATNSPFIGNYRTAGVTCIGVDLATFYVDFSAAGRPLTLMLIHDNGTPGAFEDDTAAYFMHAQEVPEVGDGWRSFTFDIASEQTTLPAGWTLLNLGDSGSPPIHTWDQVIQSVSSMRFFYGNPEFFFIFQQWALGLDNVKICLETTQPCPPDVSGNGTVDIDDLLAVIGAWGAAGGPADVTGDGIVDIDDLLAVIGGWGPCP